MQPAGDGPQLAMVIISTITRGDGRDELLRPVKQVHTLDGKLIAEDDPINHKSQREPE